MSNVLIPPAPYLSPMTDSKGILTPIWAKWINQLYLRAGGADAPSNSTFASQSEVIALQNDVTAIDANITSLSASVTTLNAQVKGLSVGRQL